MEGEHAPSGVFGFVWEPRMSLFNNTAKKKKKKN